MFLERQFFVIDTYVLYVALINLITLRQLISNRNKYPQGLCKQKKNFIALPLMCLTPEA